jgi:hypothetical protein
MQMEDATISRTFFSGKPLFEAHRVEFLFMGILERSLDAIECDNGDMPGVAEPYVARVWKWLREKTNAQNSSDCGSAHLVSSLWIQPVSPRGE